MEEKIILRTTEYKGSTSGFGVSELQNAGGLRENFLGSCYLQLQFLPFLHDFPAIH